MECIIDFDIKKFQKLMLDWYRSAKRDLPWRRVSTVYDIWISEVMLQQTQVRKVLPYFNRFIQVFPDVTKLAQAPLDDVLKLWEGLGYYARARNLHKAASYIVAYEGGHVPINYEKLLRVPGIGEYTAAAIASIAGNEAHAVVDGNVTRVMCRLFQIEKSTQIVATKHEIKEMAARLLDHDMPGDYNQAMMELGAMLCTPRKPKCIFCPVIATCAAYQNLPDPSVLPLKKLKKEVPHHNIAVAVLWDEGQIFITKREQNGVLGGMWDFPGVRYTDPVKPQRALQQELLEKYNVQADTAEFIMEIKH
ncbi:MAG: A/G-specific adenine glycosylase, partial [Calditrichaeota bacterium]